MSWLIFITPVVVVAVIAFLVWASADVGSNVYVRTLCRLSTDEKVVSLTFDDGPDREMTPKVLDILDRYGIKATFFVIGEKVADNGELVQRIVSEGHILGNHTYSHKSVFPLESAGRVQEELEKCNNEIKGITGSEPMYFRSPFGVTNPIIGKVLKRMQFKAIGWSIRSFDTVAGNSRGEVCRRVIGKLHPGAVILLHDRCAEEDVLLESLIPAILEQGYRFVPLSYKSGRKELIQG